MNKTVQRLASQVMRFIRRSATDTKMTRSMKIRPDPNWAAEVKRSLSFLFEEQGAIAVDSTYLPNSFGLETAVIKVGELILSVSRDATLPPGYIEARIAPVHLPGDFKPPVSAWMALELTADGQTPLTPPYDEFTLQGLSNLLQNNFLRINEAYSVANYPATRKKISEVEKEHWQQYQKDRPIK